MQVLFVASEAVPFVKTGGLADVVGSLPKALQQLGVDVRVVLPKYKDIPAHFKKKMVLRKKITVPLGWRNQYCGIEELRHDGVHYYFIDNEYYFKRDGLYGYGDSFDEAERFAYFSRAVLESLPHLDIQPQIIHLNDWHTGMVSLFLKTLYREKEYYQKIRTVFTIHNLKYQGLFPYEVLGDILGLGHEHFHNDGVEYYGRLSFMKAGLVYSDIITTVSETYAQEIQYPFFGFGLDGLLRKRRDQLYGILNGIDYDVYDPTNDPHLFIKYKDEDSKAQNKMLLQDMFHLPIRRDTPMMSLITRLDSQKGIDLVVRVLEEILFEEIQIVVLGTGEHQFEHRLKDAEYRHQDKLSVHLTFDEGLSRKIYAASDLFLMPSLYEPCGISQLIALRYGTIPIVRETGGLRDVVQPYNEYTGEGNGFSFTNYNAHDMLHTVRRAVHFYHDKKSWNRILNNIKRRDYSWNQSARKYIHLYQQLLQQ